MNILTPFKTVSSQEKWISIAVIVIGLMVLWGTSTSNFLPTPREIISSFPRLMEKNLIDEFITSILFCLRCMFYASVVSIFIGYLSVIPAFSMLCQFLKKFRFLPSVGFSFLFMKLTGSINEQKTWMMTFGIMTWLVYSMVEIATSISKDDLMYAKSLRLSRWSTMKELLVFGKAAEMCKAIVGNFAIAWMLLASIENIAKSSGGIGVILSESNKYYHFDEVYAIQILILIVGITIDYLGKQLVYLLFPYTKL